MLCFLSQPQWYEGAITQFDQLRWSHTVEYDDGDSEVRQGMLHDIILTSE
jgi:hypothetical protein